MKRVIYLVMLVLCFASCSEQPKEPVEKNTPTVYTFNTSYVYHGSPDPIMPSISLDIANNRYSFTYSGFSSYMPIGEFEIKDGKLYLWDNEDKTEAYVFEVTEEGYVFDAESSVDIPTYRVSGYSEDRYTPVPDGALFEPDREEGELTVNLTNGWVKRQGDNEVYNFSYGDLKAIADMIEGKEWDEGLPDCACDCRIYVSGIFMGYHSSCGTLNTLTPSYTSHSAPDGKSLRLSEAEAEKINSILEKYILLGVVE